MELADVIRGAVSGGGVRSKIDPATRTFQALRIVINDELGELARGLEAALDCLCAGGRLVVITFHSLEDRLVKTAFRDKDQWENLTPKPVTATAVEKKMNPRSRTAKLRAAVLKNPERSERA